MKVLPLVLASLALVLPSSSDITITTRSSYGPDVNAPVEMITVQLKGARQRMVRHTNVPRSGASFTYTTIAQCDVDRVISINDVARLYAVEAIPHVQTADARHVRPRTAMLDARPIIETQTIDSVDSGERRTYGPFAARHVVTTTTVERVGVPPSVTNVRDGWYIDLPPANCEKPGDLTYTLLASVERGGRTDVRFKGTAKTGFAIEEREHHMPGTSRASRTVTLVEFSEAPIPASRFEIPDGYQRALQLPFGGSDLSRPDTLWNRASAYWSLASSWAAQWWR
jgi:hypothetical protein